MPVDGNKRQVLNQWQDIALSIYAERKDTV